MLGAGSLQKVSARSGRWVLYFETLAILLCTCAPSDYAKGNIQTLGSNMSQIQFLLVGLAATYVMTFVCGFLQATPYNFLNHVFFFLLFVGGGVLVGLASRTMDPGLGRWSLYATSASTTLLFVCYAGYEVTRQLGYADVSARLEGFLYLLTLVFWILIIASFVLLRRDASGGAA